MLRKENELMVKKARLNVLYFIHNIVVSLTKVPETEKSFEQKFRLMDLYKKQTKNNVNRFISLFEFLEKINASITNFKNAVEKLQKEISQTGEKEIQNGYDVIAEVSSQFPFQINAQTTVVAEFLSYVKIAKRKAQQQKQQNNGKG